MLMRSAPKPPEHLEPSREEDEEVVFGAGVKDDTEEGVRSQPHVGLTQSSFVWA